MLPITYTSTVVLLPPVLITATNSEPYCTDLPTTVKGTNITLSGIGNTSYGCGSMDLWWYGSDKVSPQFLQVIFLACQKTSLR